MNYTTKGVGTMDVGVGCGLKNPKKAASVQPGTAELPVTGSADDTAYIPAAQIEDRPLYVCTELPLDFGFRRSWDNTR